METKEIKINLPEGFEIDKENSTFECIKFKPIEKKLPKTWEEYCKTHPKRGGESWIDQISQIASIDITEGRARNCKGDKNLLPNKEYAEAMLALCQLIQLRDCYNNGWIPNWANSIIKYSICVINDEIVKTKDTSINCILAFKSKELRDKFLNNFRDLIETAKSVL